MSDTVTATARIRLGFYESLDPMVLHLTNTMAKVSGTIDRDDSGDRILSVTIKEPFDERRIADVMNQLDSYPPGGELVEQWSSGFVSPLDD